jgi:hypothetical protein
MKQPVKVVMLPALEQTYQVNQSNLFINYPKDYAWGRLELLMCQRVTSHGNAWNGKGIKTNINHLYITVSQDVEPIKEGDWFIKLRDVYPTGLGELHLCKQDRGNEKRTDKDWTLQVKYGNEEVLQKIIATTDPKLKIECQCCRFKKVNSSNLCECECISIPQLQQSFLNEFVANPDGEWEVDYEYYTNAKTSILDQILKLKLYQDNTVNITSVENKMYSREEVIAYGNKTFRRGINEGYLAYPVLYTKTLTEDWIKENLQ